METPSPSDIVKAELRFPAATPDSMSTSSPSDTPNTPEGGTGRYEIFLFRFIQTLIRVDFIYICTGNVKAG